MASAAFGFTSCFSFAILHIAVMAIIGAGWSPNVRTVYISVQLALFQNFAIKICGRADLLQGWQPCGTSLLCHRR